MGNAATCSLVDVVGTVSVTQADGQVVEFVQPIFAWQVRKLHPGNWLVHYVSVHDPDFGEHSKMSMLQGSEELQAGEIYFLLRIPSQFRKQLFGSSKQRSSSSKATVAAAGGLPAFKPSQISKQQQQAPVRFDSISTHRALRNDPTPIFSITGSPTPSFPTIGSPIPQARHYQRKCSGRHRTQAFDWQPTLMTIQEVF